MKNYVKPELDIVEFQLNIDIVSDSDPFNPFEPFGDFDVEGTDEIFIGEEEGYVT